MAKEIICAHCKLLKDCELIDESFTNQTWHCLTCGNKFEKSQAYIDPTKQIIKGALGAIFLGAISAFSDGSTTHHYPSDYDWQGISKTAFD